MFDNLKQESQRRINDQREKLYPITEAMQTIYRNDLEGLTTNDYHWSDAGEELGLIFANQISELMFRSAYGQSADTVSAFISEFYLDHLENSDKAYLFSIAWQDAVRRIWLQQSVNAAFSQT